MARYEACIRVKAADPDDARAAYAALMVEASSQPSGFTRVEVKLEGTLLTLRFSSDKRTSLRAALNGFLRLLAAIERMSTAISEWAEWSARRSSGPPNERTT